MTGSGEPRPGPATYGPLGGIERALREVPVRWRILGIAVLNSALAIVLLAVIWDSAKILGAAWTDLRRVQSSERFLNSLGGDAERLQSLIHRYFAQSEPAILARIVPLRETLVSRLRVQALLDPLISRPARELTDTTERFVAGFDDLRETRTGLSHAYETKIVGRSKEMGPLYTQIGDAVSDRSEPLWQVLGRSRETFNAMILASNAFFLSGQPAAGDEARRHAAAIRGDIALMRDLATAATQRTALDELDGKAETVAAGLDELGIWFATQARLLKEAVDDNAQSMSAAIDAMRAGMQGLERSAQARFDRTLDDVGLKLGLLAVAFVALVALLGLAIARSISRPLALLQADMAAVTSGDLGRPIAGLAVQDEIGRMARAVDVFRENAVARREAEEALRRAKERAEATLAEIRAMQASLIEAEKLAALGGLVAGVAHEVNNPVGISLTVASTLAARSDAFAAELGSGPLRRSRLDEFTAGVRDAARQLVANLERAADLVQSFKQVAVDRSQAERRRFELREAVEQILASLRPSLRSARVALVVDVPDGIVLDSFPGPLGQVLTNLFLNAVHHAFANRSSGQIALTARRSGPDTVQIVFRDDGEGMSEDVQRRAFDPFFTTRRGAGGTGLGLHIVYNIVTRRLGGRIILSSAPGSGTTFLIVLPLDPSDEARPDPVTPAQLEAMNAGP